LSNRKKMNKKDSIFLRNKLLQKVGHVDRFGNKEGMIKIHLSNSLEHEKTKLEVAYKLKKLGFEVWSECKFVGGGRGDLVVIRGGIGYIIEILVSETIKRFNLKKKKYPKEFRLIKIYSNKLNMGEFKI